MTIQGKVVAITRAVKQAGDLRQALLEQGASVLEFPLIQFQAPTDRTRLDTALHSVAEYDWLVFTSANGVEHFFAALQNSGFLSSLRAKFAVVGKATAAALIKQGMKPSIMPDEYRAEAVLESLLGCGITGSRILLARAAVGRDVLPDGLRKAGARVDVVAVYETVPDLQGAEALCRALQNHQIDIITFTSSSTVQNYVAYAGERAVSLLCQVCVACIGPITAATALAAGLHVDVVAEEYSVAGLVKSLTQL